MSEEKKDFIVKDRRIFSQDADDKQEVDENTAEQASARREHAVGSLREQASARREHAVGSLREQT